MARQVYSRQRAGFAIFAGCILKLISFIVVKTPEIDTIFDDSCQSESSTYPLKPPKDVPSTMYKPKGMYEVIRWTQFTKEAVYEIINDEPKLPMNEFWNEEIQAISQVAILYINAKTNSTWSLVKFQNGYIKNDALQGTQYIVDLDLKRTNEECSYTQRFRVELVHYLLPIKSSSTLVTTFNERLSLKVFIFVTLDSPNLKKLVENFPTGTYFKSHVLLIIVTDDTNRDINKIQKIQNDAKLAKMQKENFDVTVLIRKSIFDRSVILKEAVNEYVKKPNDIVMILDEDVTIKTPLINHCRILLKPQKTVYFPVAFGQFNPKLVVKGMPPGKSKDINIEDHNKFTGQWLPYNYDYLCSYGQDIKTVMSQLFTVHSAPVKKSLGLLLNEQFMKQGFEVIRSVSPALYKHSVSTKCVYNENFASKNKEFCLHEKVMGMASKPALGILYLTDIEKRKQIKDKEK